MKKIVSAAGMAALGVVGLHAAAGDGLTRMEASKPWSLKANLRGFYDDNVFTTPDKISQPYLNEVGNPILQSDGTFMSRTLRPVSSYGIEIQPSATFNLVTDQSLLSLGYQYGYRWYEDRPGRSADQSHVFDVSLTHDLDPLTSISFGDNFTLAQEPEIVDSATVLRPVNPMGDATAAQPFRANLDSIHNKAFLSLDRGLSETLSAHVGYQFDIYRYADDGYNGSFSSRLDRNQHQINLHLAAQIADPTTVLLGYQFRNVGFTSSDDLGRINNNTYLVEADSRDTDTHVVFVGANHAFSPELQGSARAGAQFVSYTGVSSDHPYDLDDSQASPYVDINANYSYYEGSSIAVGMKHERNQTDLALIAGGQALDQETTSIYASLNHRLTSRITASAVGLYSMSRFDDSARNLGDDDYFSLGLNANYVINQYLSAELGYNFDDLDSSLGQDQQGNELRSFSRNRVYVGLSASY
jgi:hypothetical protein